MEELGACAKLFLSYEVFKYDFSTEGVGKGKVRTDFSLQLYGHK